VSCAICERPFEEPNVGGPTGKHVAPHAHKWEDGLAGRRCAICGQDEPAALRTELRAVYRVVVALGEQRDAARDENAALRALVAALAHSADNDADGAPEIEALCQWAYHHHPDWADDRPRPRPIR
jgi:hypothetical protein